MPSGGGGIPSLTSPVSTSPFYSSHSFQEARAKGVPGSANSLNRREPVGSGGFNTKARAELKKLDTKGDGTVSENDIIDMLERLGTHL